MTLLAAIAREAQDAFDDFDEEASWTPAGGTAQTLRGVFDRVSEVTDIGEMIQMDGVAAMLNVATADASGVARDDAIVVRETSYRVVGLEPDGSGRTVLVLGI